MARTELPWLLLGRQVRPVALVVAVATATIAWALLDPRQTPTGAPAQLGWPIPSVALGVAAAVAAGLLCWGWWARAEWAHTVGLWLAGGVWAARTCFLVGQFGAWSQSATLSACWAALALLSWHAERRHVRP